MLTFTGTKRYNYDRAELLAAHGESITAVTRRLFVDAACGRITGCLLITTSGDGKSGMTMHVNGIFQEDREVRERVADFFADHDADFLDLGGESEIDED